MSQTDTEEQSFEAKIDRLSDLPDSILTYILGKLPTKYAVGTAILSTRWKHLFAQIPNPDISIEDNELLYPNPEYPWWNWKIYDLLYTRRRENFIKFMYNLLNVTLQDFPRIRKFHLELNLNYDRDEENSIDEEYVSNDHLNKWISAALRLNVSYLWFYCPNVFDGSPNSSIFCCASLVEIMLSWNAAMCVPNSVNLPNLKCLYLKHVLFHDDGLTKVLSGCPVLEELCLCYCEFSVEKYTDVNSHAARIFSPSVKRFKWFRCVANYRYGIEFDMPALNSLCYVDYSPKYFLVKNLNSLRKACIDPLPTTELENLQPEDRVLYLKNVADLVLGCSKVEFWSLSNHSIEAIRYFINSVYPFRNLIELELPKIGTHGWMLLPDLLKNAPNLEILVFAKGFCNSKGCYNSFQSHVKYCPSWSSFKLQRIRFEDFDGEDDEIEIVNCFLREAKLLRKIEIKFSLLCEEKLAKAVSKIGDLQKSSKECHIELIFGVFGEPIKKFDRSFGMREWY